MIPKGLLEWERWQKSTFIQEARSSTSKYHCCFTEEALAGCVLEKGYAAQPLRLVSMVTPQKYKQARLVIVISADMEMENDR